MQFSMARVLACGLTLVGSLTVMTGCSSDEGAAAVSRRVDTVDGINDMRKDLTRADAQVVATQQTLDRLSTQRAGDLEKTYKQFRSDVDRDESMSNRINGRASALTSDSYRQINEWNYQSRTIRDEHLRQKSLEQEAAAKKDHDEMVAGLNDLRGAYTNYIRALQDIETFAANNLTPQGLAQLSDQRSAAADLAQQLRHKLATLDGRLDQLAGAWQTNVPLAQRITEQGIAVPAGSAMREKDEDSIVPANSPVSSPPR